MAFRPHRSTAIPAGYTAQRPSKLPTASATPISSYSSCILKLPIIGTILKRPPTRVSAWANATPLTNTNPVFFHNNFNCFSKGGRMVPSISFAFARCLVSLTAKIATDPAIKLANPQNQKGASSPKF